MAQVTVENLPGFVEDANKPSTGYILTLEGQRCPLTSIDAAYAMANITCQTFVIGQNWLALMQHPAYKTAPDYIKTAIKGRATQLQLVQGRNLLCLAMLFRAYSIRVGFQTDYMAAHNWRLDRITAPDSSGDATLYSVRDYDDWVTIAKNITDDAIRSNSRKPSIVLSAGGSGTMQGMGTAAVLAPVALAAAEAGTATAATTGAVAAAEVAGAGVVATGGTAAAGLFAALTWPIVGVVAVITLGAVTTYAIKKGFDWWQNRDAATTKASEEDNGAYHGALEDLKNCTTEECRQNARERIAILNKRRDDNAAQAGGLGNALFGGTFDFQKIAYTALGITAAYLGLQLFLQNRPKSSEA